MSLKTDNGTAMSALNVKNIPKLSPVLPSKEILQFFEHEMRPLREKNGIKSSTINDIKINS